MLRIGEIICLHPICLLLSSTMSRPVSFVKHYPCNLPVLLHGYKFRLLRYIIPSFHLILGSIPVASSFLSLCSYTFFYTSPIYSFHTSIPSSQLHPLFDHLISLSCLTSLSLTHRGRRPYCISELKRNSFYISFFSGWSLNPEVKSISILSITSSKSGGVKCFCDMFVAGGDTVYEQFCSGVNVGG